MQKNLQMIRIIEELQQLFVVNPRQNHIHPINLNQNIRNIPLAQMAYKV